MKFSFWAIGKQHEAYVKQGVDEFTKRISKYYTVDWTIIPVPKKRRYVIRNGSEEEGSRNHYAMAEAG